MKGFKLGLVIMAVALFTIGLGGMAYAFHSGGVANCDGCHTMHGVYSGSTSIAGKGPSLLVGVDPSSTCLLCHAGVPTGNASIGGGPKIMTYPFPGTGVPPSGFNQGGDFAWLQKQYGSGSSLESYQSHGHNVVALDFGMPSDPDYPTSPGGGLFPSGSLGCNSCHDPHGTYRRVGISNSNWTVGNPTQLGSASLPISGSGSRGAAPVSGVSAVGTYRLLAGLNYSQGGVGGILVGYPGAPLAVYNPSTSVSTSPTTGEGTLSTQNRIAYAAYLGSGVVPWGQWCGACHPQMLSTVIPSPSTVTTHVHPVDVPLNSGGEDQIYNSYVSTGLMNGTVANSFLSLVPFMEGNQYNVDTLAAHAATGYVNGPAPTDQVSCLSCHRAHASGFKYMLRWDMTNEFLTIAGPTWQLNGGRTLAEVTQAYYGRSQTYFPAYQRVLCNKCHAKD